MFMQTALTNNSMYERESVNMSQMYIKRKKWYSNLGRTYISRHILYEHQHTCPIALPVSQNPQHRILLTVVSATSTPQFQILLHQRNFCLPAVNRFTPQKTLPILNRKHFFMNILCIDSFCSQKRTTKHYPSVVHSSNMVTILTAEIVSEHAHLLPRLLWSWTVLLPSDTYREPITSITAILLPFVTYLLTQTTLLLPHTPATKF
jgi:hypothetical protein